MFYLQGLYKIQQYLCLMIVERIQADTYEDANKAIIELEHKLPYVVYEAKEGHIVTIKDALKNKMNPNEIIDVVDGNNHISYNDFMLQLKRMADYIGLKELPFEPIMVSVRNAPF